MQINIVNIKSRDYCMKPNVLDHGIYISLYSQHCIQHQEPVNTQSMLNDKLVHTTF